MKKSLALLLSLVMLLGIAAGCDNSSNGAPATGPTTENTDTGTGPATSAPEPTSASTGEKVLIVRASSDPVSFNPNGTSDDAAFTIVGNIFSKVVTLDSAQEIIPDLASSWETAEDGLSMTFHLVQNATFHDGEPVTAEDVVYTFEYIITEETCLMHVRFADVIESVVAEDDYTVTFHLKYPSAGFLGYLGYYAAFIMPKHIYDNGKSWDETAASIDPIGSGPFQFVRHNPGESVILEKNENFFKTEVKLDRLIFRQIPDAATAVQSLISGEIDLMGTIPDANVDQLLSNPDFNMTLSVLPSPTYMFFNFEHEDVLTLAVRQAIATAIDRDDISKKVFNGTRAPEYNFYPSVAQWVSNSGAPAPSFDVAAAAQILEDAGYTKDADGFYVRGITLDCFSTDSSPDVAKLIKSTCEEAGIEIDIIVSEYQAWMQKVSVEKDFMIAMQGGYQGPDVSALSGRVGSGGASNYGNYSNAEIDALFLEGLLTTDQEVRRPIYYRIQELLRDDLPIIPVVAYATYVATRSDVINTPTQSAGRAGWVEYAYTDFQ